MHTKTLPIFIVSTGSMCVPYDRSCNGWSHPFAQTIHVGDIIVVEGINPKNLNVNYPNSDVIVFQNPSDTTGVPIVHRLTSEILKDGKYYFYTKGDGNPPAPWPSPVEKYALDQGWYDPAYYNENPTVPVGSIPQDLVIGRVVMRIPWIGWVTILTAGLQDWIAQHGINAIAAIVIIIATLLISLELALPHMKRKKKKQP